MCLFSHVAAGALAGALSPNPHWAPLFGLGSHVLLDILPHYDFEKTLSEAIFAICAVTVLAVGGVLHTAVVLGIIFGVIPDIENLLWRLGKIRDDQKIFPGHVKILPHGRAAGIANLYLQVVASAVVLILLVRGYV